MKTQHTARIANMIMGVWLMLSSLIWHHTSAQFINIWLVGIFVILVSLSGIWAPSARYLNTLLALWLFLSAWGFTEASAATIWNSVITSVVIFAFSLIP